MFELMTINGEILRFNRETGATWRLVIDKWVPVAE